MGSASLGRATAGRPVTLSDVAEVAGVSVATASRALNGSSRNVTVVYRRRVQAAAKSLGYSPNLSAQATARGTSAAVALLVADIADPYFGEIAAGVSRGADQAGLLLTIVVTGREPGRELAALRALRGQRPRGVVLAASRGSGGLDAELRTEIERIEALGGRVVTLGPPLEKLHTVSIDNFGGARALGLAAGRQGYRRSICLAAPKGVVTSDERLAGFIAGFTESGGQRPAVYRGAFTRESGQRMAAEAIRCGLAPGEYVFAISDIIALGAMEGIRSAGLRIGDDIAIAGFDDIEIGREMTPSLTTVQVPLREFGYRAMQAVLADGAQLSAGRLGFTVLTRQSTPDRAASRR